MNSTFDTDDLAAAHRGVEQAIAGRDSSVFASLYTDDAALLPPDGSLITGRAAIAEAFDGWLAAGFVRQTVESVEVCGDGGIAIEEGLATGRFVCDGHTRDARSRYLIVHLRQGDGRWLMHRDIWTSVLGDLDDRQSGGY